MRLAIRLWAIVAILVSSRVGVAASLPGAAVRQTRVHDSVTATEHSALRSLQAQAQTRPHAQVDVNRPRSPFDCELPIGEQWYGSRARCLAYLCAGQNVYNEYVFDSQNRRRRNPCYGQNPTEFPGE